MSEGMVQQKHLLMLRELQLHSQLPYLEGLRPRTFYQRMCSMLSQWHTACSWWAETSGSSARDDPIDTVLSHWHTTPSQ
jgi:hypothetical protein